MTSAPVHDDPATVPLSIAMQRPQWRDTFTALRVRNYRLYAIGQAFVNTSQWTQRIAVDWLVLELTGSVALVGLTIALQFLPTLLLSAWAGVIADRLPKRAVLAGAQASIAVLNAVLAILAVTGTAQLWSVYALVLATGVLATFDGPARSAFVGEMVGPHHLRNAISMNASIFQLGALVGPAIAGVLIVAIGSGWAIGVNVIGGLVGVVVVLLMRTDELLPAPRRATGKGQIREAVRYVLRKPTIFWPMLMLAIVSMFGMSLPAILAGMADDVYGTGAAGYGLYNSLFAAGALLGALASTRRSGLRLRTIVLGAFGYGLLLIAAGVAPFAGVFLALLVAMGLSRLLYGTATETIIQLSSNMAIRGRIMAFWVMVLVGGQAIGGPLMGWIAEHWGPASALVISGAIVAAAAAAIALVLARQGRLSVKVQPRRHGRWIQIVPKKGA
jgi:MFS family permease